LLAGALAGAGLGVGGCSPNPATQKAEVDPRVAIPAQIDKGIELLEAGKNREAMEALVNPDLVKTWKDDKEFDKVVGEFAADGKAKALLAALKQAKGQAPTFDADKTTAEFSRGEKEDALIFVKGDGGWYIRN
jgi:hypothetical protein